MNTHSITYQGTQGPRYCWQPSLWLLLLLALLPLSRSEATVKQVCLQCNLIITIDSTGRLLARETGVEQTGSKRDHLIVGIENQWNVTVPSLYLHGNGIFDFTRQSENAPYPLLELRDEPSGYVFGSDAKRPVNLNVFNQDEGEIIFSHGLKPGEDAWFVLRKKPGLISMMVHSVPNPSLISLLSLGLIGIGLFHPSGREET